MIHEGGATLRLPEGGFLVGVWIAFALGLLVVPASGALIAFGVATPFVLAAIGAFVSVVVRPGWWA